MSEKDPINIRGFKKVFTNFVQENERGIRRQLRRGAVGSKSFNGTGSLSLGNSPARRNSFNRAIALEAYEISEISPRDHLKLNRLGKSKKDFDQYVCLVSPRLDRRDSLISSEAEFEKELEKQINNLKSETSPKKIRKSISYQHKRRSSI